MKKWNRIRRGLVCIISAFLIIGVLFAGVVSAELVADFSIQDECGLIGYEYPDGDYLLFADTTTSPNGEKVISWEWRNSISGNFSDVPKPERYLLPAGPSYVTVNLTVEGDKGSVDTASKTVYVLKDLHIDANFSYIVDYEPEIPLVRFIDQSETSGQNIIGWYWNINDYEYVNVQLPEVNLPSGEYNVILVVVTDKGGMSRVEKSIVVNPTKSTLPTANFNYTYNNDESDGLNTTVVFNDESIGNPVSWLWDFGDYSFSNERNPVHKYDLFGTYQVSLVISNSAGTDNIKKSVQLPIPQKPIEAKFSITKTGLRTWKILNESDGPVLFYLLDMGDGTLYESKERWNEKYHTFERAGNYLVSLYVLNDGIEDNYRKFSERIYVL